MGVQMSSTMRVLGGAVAAAGSLNLWMRYTDRVEGDDPFSQHSRVQQKKHWISGMHEPYIPNALQRKFVEEHFPKFQCLLPRSLNEIDQQSRLQSAVQLEYLAKCPVSPSQLPPGGTVVVGGPPALLSTAFENGVIYINDGRRPPIANASALHLEWDSPSEGPTSSQPVHFMRDQLKRLVFPEFLADAQRTGHFSWKSLDWISWIQNPSKWLVGARVAIAFQRFTQSGPHPEVMREVAARAERNQHCYKLLDKLMGHQLLLPGAGSVYIARTPGEKKSLESMQQDLAEEGREFPFLSDQEITKAFGNRRPKGVAFANKIHDSTLSFDFVSQLSARIIQKRGHVIDGHVIAVYTDDPDQGGIVEYRINATGEKHYTRFQKLVMSLGTQQVLGVDKNPLFDIVAARGVSFTALLHLPEGTKLPAATVCGATNHVTRLAGPVLHQGKNVFLARMTCAACITPKSDSACYDAVAAIGLRTAVSEVLGGEVEVLGGRGCSRQVSRYGQIHWLQVNKTLKAAARGLTPRGTSEDIGSSLPNKKSGIYIQYGAGGGGLTMGPSQP